MRAASSGRGRRARNGRMVATGLIAVSRFPIVNCELGRWMQAQTICAERGQSAGRNEEDSSGTQTERSDFAVDLLLVSVTGESQVVVSLQTGPQFGGGSKKTSQPQGRIGGDAAFLQNYLVNAAGRHAQGAGERVLGKLERSHKFFAQNFAGMNWRPFPGFHIWLMIVHNFDIKGIRVLPPEADAPLLVDPNTKLARAIAL